MKKSVRPSPVDKPPDIPTSMVLTDRDKAILEAIYTYGGMLADYQIQRLFGMGRTQSKLRLKLLFENGYLNRPSRWKRAEYNFGFFWLARKGSAYVAGLSGESNWRTFMFPNNPRWSQINHDILIVDFRLEVEVACTLQERFILHQWINERVFKSDPDRVKYANRRGHMKQRSIVPDGYFMIQDRRERGVARMFLELDRATKDINKMLDEKILPFASYIQTNEYKKRFDVNRGWLLFVVPSKRRLLQLKETVERYVDPRLQSIFWFAEFEQVTAQLLLTTPIWYRGGQREMCSLFTF